MSTLTTEALSETPPLSAPGIQMEVVSCAAAHEARSAAEKILDIMTVVGRKRMGPGEVGKEGGWNMDSH